jgi:hypothetical protein
MPHEDYYSTADPYANDYSVEEANTADPNATDESVEEVENPTSLYLVQGFLYIWMACLGLIIWGFYPGLINSNTWWKQQCPATAWSVASVKDASTAGIANCVVPTAECPTIVLATNNAKAIVNGWTLA